MKVIVYLIFILILSIILTPYLINFFKINSLNEPQFKTYRSDETSFLMTFYLMERGENYYQAFRLSRENFATGNFLQNDAFSFRMPTVFFIWNFCCNSGEQILTLFIFLVSLMLIAVHLMLKKIINRFAILGPLILIPYLYDTFAYRTAFLFTEWWALIFFIFGLFGIFSKHNLMAASGLLLSAVIRELFIVPIFVMLIHAILRRENYKLFLVIFFSALFIYFLHIQNVSNILGNQDGLNFNFFERFHRYSLENLQAMMSFSMRQYVLGGLKTHFLLVLLGIFSLGLNLLKKEKSAVYLFLSVAGFLIFLPIISVFENDYWGIMFIPLSLISIPLIFNGKIKK